MAFDQSLKKAVELGGTAKRFHQQEGVCLAHTIRWMIDQLMGREFGKAADSPGYQKDAFDERIKQIAKSVLKSKNEKGGTLFPGLKAYEPLEASNLTPFAAQGHLSKKFKANVTTKEKTLIRKNDIFPPELEWATKSGLLYIPLNLKHKAGALNAYMISYRTESVSNQMAQRSFNHAVGAFAREDKTNFFDPNMGEVAIPIKSFEEWFKTYVNDCNTLKEMTAINSVQLYRIRGEIDLNQYVKSVKKATFEKVQKQINDFATDFSFDETFDLDLTSGELDAVTTPTGEVDPFDDIKLIVLDTSNW